MKNEKGHFLTQCPFILQVHWMDADFLMNFDFFNDAFSGFDAIKNQTTLTSTPSDASLSLSGIITFNIPYSKFALASEAFTGR